MPSISVNKKSHPYRCNRGACQHRTALPVGTQDGVETCSKCKRGTYTLERYRLRSRISGGKDHPERCDCNGSKSRTDEKYFCHDGVTIIRGPHRKGQRGCQHHKDYGKTDYQLYLEEMK